MGTQTVIITGAAGGIGSALTESLLKGGYSVIAVLRDERSSIHLKEKFANMHDALKFDYADFASSEDIRRLGKRLAEDNESINWLIHCAGYIAVPETRESLESNFQINAFAPMRLSLDLKDHIATDGGVIFISSTAGLWGSDIAPIYAASKSTLHGFAFSLQKIFGATKRSIVVCPGPTNTSLREAFAHDASTHQSPEKVADLILNGILRSSVPDARDQRLFAIRKGSLEKISCEPDKS